MLFLLLLSGGTPVITTGRLPKTWTGLSVPRKMTCWARFLENWSLAQTSASI